MSKVYSFYSASVSGSSTFGGVGPEFPDSTRFDLIWARKTCGSHLLAQSDPLGLYFGRRL